MYADHGSATVEWHPAAQLWVAYHCGCSECPKGFGKTQEKAIADLEECFATLPKGSPWA